MTKNMEQKTKTRKDLLTAAWVGEPLVINGRELILSAGKNELLTHWGNILFDKNSGRDQTEAAAYGEMIVLCMMSGPDEIKEFRSLSEAERHLKVLDFMLYNEDDFERAKEWVDHASRMVSAALVEAMTPGKHGEERTQTSSLESPASRSGMI